MSLDNVMMRVRGALRAASLPPIIPTNVIPPRLFGSVAVDGTVDFIGGTWIGPPTTFTFQLYLDGVAVSGATGPSYTFVAGDEGKVPVLAEIPAIGETAFSDPLPPVGPAQATDPTLFLGEALAGSGDGSEIADRAAWTGLNSFIGSPGVATIGVYEPDGVISQSVPNLVNNGGTVDDPITIAGVDAAGAPLLTQTRGNRSDPWTPGSNDGGDNLQLGAGADHLHFEYLDFKDVQTGLRVVRSITDLTVENGKFTNCRRGLHTGSLSGTNDASIDGLTVKNTVFSGFSFRGINIVYNTRNFLLEDLDLDSEGQDLDSYAIGVHLGATANNGIVRRVRVSRCLDSTALLATGFLSDAGTNDIEFLDSIAERCDGPGFDIDGTSHTLTDLRAYDCRINFRAVRSLTLTRPKGFDPRNIGSVKAQVVVVSGQTVTIVDGAFVAPLSSTVPVFYLQAGAALVLAGFSVQKGSGAALVAGPGAANVTGLGTEVTPPVCTSIPSITGTKAVGNVLNGSNGTWTGASTFEYQWLRDGLYIFGARSATYTVVAADLDADISRRVFAIDATGRWVGEATSVVIGAAVNVPPNFLTAPTISGEAKVGAILTATDGTVEGTPTPTVTRQWVRGASTEITGAEALTYDVQAADEGFALKIRNDAVSTAGTDSIESAATAVVTEPPEETGGIFVGPTAAGTGDGLSFANRKGGGLGSLPGLVSSLGAGSVIKVVNDFGVYAHVGGPNVFTGDGGATSIAKIKILGWNGAGNVAAKVHVRSSRTTWTRPADATIDHAPPGPYGNADVRNWSTGQRIFSFRSGVNNLEIADFHFERCGDGAIFFEGGHTGFILRDLTFYNVKRFINMAPGANVHDSAFYDISGIGFSESAIAIRGVSHHVTLGTPGTPGTYSIDVDSGRQDGDAFAMGIQFDCTPTTNVASPTASGSNMELYRVRTKNCHQQVGESSGSYWNADGVTWGRPGNYPRAYMEDCASDNCTDGGVDVQGGHPSWSAADNPRYLRCVNSGNKMNYRLSHGKMVDCESYTPIKRGGSGILSHIQMGGRSTAVIEGGKIIGPARAIDTLHDASRVDCRGVEIDVSTQSGPGTLFGGPGTLTLDDACFGASVPTHDDFSVPTFIIANSRGGGTNLIGANAGSMPLNKVGDIAIALFSAGNAGPATIDPNWNYFGADVVVGSFVARLAWRRMDLQYIQYIQWRGGASTDGGGRFGVIAMFDGCVATGDPFEGYAITSGTGSVMTSPTTVVSGAGRMVCRAFLQKTNVQRSGAPAGWTEAVARVTGFGNGCYLDTKAGIGASTEAASVSNRTGSIPWASFGFALKPQ